MHNMYSYIVCMLNKGFSAHSTNIAYDHESLSCCLFSGVSVHEDRYIEKGYTSNYDVVEVGAG